MLCIITADSKFVHVNVEPACYFLLNVVSKEELLRLAKWLYLLFSFECCKYVPDEASKSGITTCYFLLNVVLAVKPSDYPIELVHLAIFF